MSRHRIPTASASASTWATVAMRRSAAFSLPAPLIRHGLRWISSSSTAVSMMPPAPTPPDAPASHRSVPLTFPRQTRSRLYVEADAESVPHPCPTDLGLTGTTVVNRQRAQRRPPTIFLVRGPLPTDGLRRAAALWRGPGVPQQASLVGCSPNHDHTMSSERVTARSGGRSRRLRRRGRAGGCPGR